MCSSLLLRTCRWQPLQTAVKNDGQAAWVNSCSVNRSVSARCMRIGHILTTWLQKAEKMRDQSTSTANFVDRTKHSSTIGIHSPTRAHPLNIQYVPLVATTCWLRVSGNTTATPHTTHSYLDLCHFCQQRILISSQNLESVRCQPEIEISAHQVYQDAPYLVGVPRNLEVPCKVVKKRLCG